MGSTLFGGEKSGTPIETRGGTSDIASFYQNLLKHGGPEALASMFGRGATQGMINMLGFDPSTMGLGDTAAQVLMDPTDTTAGLFRSMQPFEQRETDRQVAGLRDIFGAMGGRFSRNVAGAEGTMRSQMSQGYDVNRYNALLSAGGQRANALMGILGAVNQARGQAFNEQVLPMQMMQSFFQPGAPQQTEGILPGLLQLAGTALLTRGMGGMPGGAPGSAAGGFPTWRNPGTFVPTPTPNLPPIIVR